MANTTNFGWETPDDTDLVKDGAAAMRTLGSAIDTTTKALNPETTLGDISYRSSTANTNTRLGIGTTGQVLTVSGGVPAWETPAASGMKSMTLLNAGGTALTGAATITVSGISNQQALWIMVLDGSSVNASSTISLRINADTGSNYYLLGNEFGASSNNSYDSTSATSIRLGTMANVAGSVLRAGVTLLGTNSTSGQIVANVSSMCNGGGGTGQTGYAAQGYYTCAAAVSSISLISSSGNFDNGTLYVYGMAA
jgi:hypothetical protein